MDEKKMKVFKLKMFESGSYGELEDMTNDFCNDKYVLTIKILPTGFGYLSAITYLADKQ